MLNDDRSFAVFALSCLPPNPKSLYGLQPKHTAQQLASILLTFKL
jgi:hypothetical protein